MWCPLVGIGAQRDAIRATVLRDPAGREIEGDDLQLRTGKFPTGHHRALRRLPNHQHRTFGVVNQVLADRAEDRIGELPTAVAAHHQ